MLQKLVLTNFQKHKKFVLPLNKTVTCIVGDNGSGKSSLLRALYFVCCNKPSGTHFIKSGETSVKVSLFCEEHKVTRLKSKQENSYRVDNKVLQAVSGTVPDEVQSILHTVPENFQKQHDASYLFSLSPGQVTKQLNKVINLEVADNTIARLTSRLRKAKTTVEVSKDRLRASKKKKAELSWVPDFVYEVNELQTAERNLEDLDRNITSLSKLLLACTHWQSQLKELPDLEELQQLSEDLAAKQVKVIALKDLISQIEYWVSEVYSLQVQEGLAANEVTKFLSNGCPVCGRAMPKPFKKGGLL